MALRERCPDDSYSHDDLSALEATQWVSHSQCRIRQSFRHASPREFLLGHQSESGPDNLSRVLQQPRLWERFPISLCAGPEVEGAVVCQCSAADRVAECVRREPDGTRCKAGSRSDHRNAYTAIYALA